MNNNQLMHFSKKRIDWLLDTTQARLTGEELPTKDEFMEIWRKLTKPQRNVVAAGIQCETLSDWVAQIPGLTYPKIYKFLDSGHLFMKALIIGRMSSMPSDVAKATYLENLMTNEKSRMMHRKDITKVVTSDREHLQELAKQITTTGDGKRQILKELIAYGMQTKMHTEAMLDELTGAVVQPAVYTLADPRISLISLQELNKMDHEYQEAASSTSSTESQADRIKRLKSKHALPIDNKGLVQRVTRAADRQAKELGGIAAKLPSNIEKPLEA